MLALQSSAGNRAVGTLLFRQAADVGPKPVSKEVPGLPAHVLIRVEEHLATGSASGAQAAIDLVVGVLAARGDINLALIKGRRMRFDPALTDEGHTQQWAKPSRGGGFHPLPSTVRIGPPAMTNASWLYTAIIHEYRHAETFQTAQSDPFKEVDAYLHNIEQADEAGIDGGEVLEIWGRLRDEWAEVPDSLKPIYQERYYAAETTVRRITGTTSMAAPVANRPVQRSDAEGAPSTTTRGPAHAATAHSALPADSQADAKATPTERLPDRPSVQRSPGSDESRKRDQTTLTYAGSPGMDRLITEDDPEFRANYIDNNIVLATGLCLPGTTWGNIDHASVPQIQLTYRDGRQLTIAVADVPLVPDTVRKRAPMTGAARPLRYEKRSDGFIYPIKGDPRWAFISYGDAANIVSLRAGLHETIEELKSLFVLMELGPLFAGAIAALGGIASLNASNKNGLFEFAPRKAKSQGTGKGGTPTPKPTRDPAAAPKTSPTHQDPESPKSTSTRDVKPRSAPRPDDEPGLKTPKVKPPKPKAGKDTETPPDRELTSGKSDKPVAKKDAPLKGKSGSKVEEKTAAEKDWEKAEAEVRRGEAEADKPTRTEHGALREQERGALTPKERGQLGNAVPRTQGDGTTARVIKQKGGGYVVHVTNQDGETITVIRNKTTEELKGLSERHQWNPPWND
jgi:hypothetical protein